MATDGRRYGGQRRGAAQRRLPGMDEPKLARHALKEELVPAGTYDPIPDVVARRRDLTAADKLVYGKLLGQLRGGSEWAKFCQPQLAAALGMTPRGVRGCIRHLEEMGLVEAKYTGPHAAVFYGFAPLYGGQDAEGAETPAQESPPQAAQAPAVPAPAANGSAGGPAGGSDGSQRVPPARSAPEAPFAPPRPPRAAPEGGGGTTFRPGTTFRGEEEQRSGGGRNNVPPRPGTTFRPSTSSDTEKSTNSAAQRCGVSVGEAGPEPEPPALPPAAGPPGAIVEAIRLAEDWEELLSLPRRGRTEARKLSDHAALFEVASDALRGALGVPQAARSALTTLAHQIGRRDPPADKPLGMFLAEVGPMRLAGFREAMRTGRGSPSGTGVDR